MEKNNQLKNIYIKKRICYYFGDVNEIENFDLDNIFINEKSYENILVYNISYKNLIAAKPLCITFVKIDGYIRVYNGTRYLVLFGNEKYDFIYNRIRCLLGLKSGITYVIFIIMQKSK